MASDAGARRRRDWNRPAGGYVTLGAVRYSVRRAPAPARRIPPVAACARDCCAACAACANCATCAPGSPRADLLAGCLGRRARADRASPDRRRTLERLQRFRFGRAASGERERRGGSVDAARPPERPRTDRTERLRELTERLRGRASFAPSPAPTPSPAPHSAPVLPVPPVPPPRHRHSRDSFDLTLCCPSPSVQPKCDVKWKRDRTIHKADSVNGEIDKCKQEDESRKEDFFDADDFHLVKVEPRSIVGSYAQKTIPFRSASFSQVDFNTSDGKYIRNLPRNVSLNSISNAPTRLENSSLSTICSGSEPSASTGLSTPQADDPASETITEAESTASVDSAVGSDEGLLGHVALSPRTPQIAGEPAHKQLGMRSLTHPLPSRSANGGSDVFNVIDGKGVRSLQCFPQGSLSGVLHEVHEESDASLADSAQAQSETVSPVDRTSLTNCFIFPTPGFTQCETCFAQINVLDENVVENIVNDQKYDAPQCSCSKSNASFNSSEEIAMANVIPVPVYECIVKEWTSAGSVEDWLDNERIEPPLPHGEESLIQNKPDIAMQDDSSLNIQQGQDSKEDETITSEQVENLLAAVQNSSKVAAPACKERKRALDKTKRRNGIYITNAQDDILLTLPESIVATEFNKIDNNHGGDVIKLETGEREVFIGDPDSHIGFCQKLRSNTSIDSDMKNNPSQEDWFPSNTESSTPVDVANAPLWPKSVVETKWPFRPKLTYQSSDEKDEESLNKANNRKCSLLLRADSLSEGESESGSVSTSNRDRTASPSPFNPSDVSDTETRSLAGKERGSHVTRRSIRPVRGPYGQMLEAERNKADFSKLSKHDEETKFINELTAQGTARFMNPNMSASRTSLSSIASPMAHSDPRPGNRTRHGNRSFDEKDLKSNKSFLDPPADKSNIRSSPKRKVSANIPYSAPNPVTESASGLVVCHQRTTSSPSKLEGLSPRNSSESKKKVNHDLLAELLRGSSEALSNGSKFDNVILCIQQNNDTRTHVVVELYDTECSYVESLEILVKKYLQPLKSPENSGLVDAFLVDEIFYQVPAILAVHQVFLEELRKRLEAWDVNQKIGDVFLDVFGKPSVMETYMSFINNWTKAKDTIKTASASRPAFARFLQAMARDHKGKLSLDNLLIKPVQKFPRYEMLIQRLIKHTDTAHPDHKLLKEAQREIHDLLVKINCTERESVEFEQQQQMLRELEALVEGLAHLVTADRTFLRHDTVTIPSAQGTTKERALFLFSDLLLITSVKRRTGTIKKPIVACQSSLASILEANKYKLLMRISLADLEIVKAKDENLRRVMREVETLTEDVTTLTQISELTAALHSPHHQLEETVREMLLAANRQLADRQNSDSQLYCLEMSLTISSGAENLSFIFPKPDKRSSWEEIFTETKQKLALSDDKRPTPEFLSPVPIRKTRAGLQFTCAAPTLPVATSSSRDVWVCNSDGYVGQVCVLTLQPKPQVTSCNGVCNARILCVACVPAASQQSASGHTSVVRQRTVDVGSSSGHSFTGSIKPGISISDADDGLKNIRLDSSSSSEEDEDGSSTSENQDNHLESKDHSTSLQASLKNIQSTSLNSTLTPSHSKSLSTPHSSQNITVHPVMKSSSNPAVDKQAMGISTGTLSTPASRQSSEDSSHASNQPTMWLGTEDGCIHVYNCNDNIRIKKNKIKLQHSSGVHCIVYVDSKVFVSLGNGDIVVYMRDLDGAWCEHKSILVGTSTCPVTKMLLSAGKLWCAQHTNVRIIDPETIQMEDSFQVGGDSLKPISHMAISGAGVWIALHNTALLKCFHAETREVITELNITPAVTKMLAGSDDIIRQHKAACLRVTSLLACKDILWVGTSAGVLLTANLSNMQQPNGQIVAPQLAGIPYGHTGHVRFLTVVETTMASTNPTKVTSQTSKSKLSNRRTLQSLATTTKAPETGTSGPKDLLVISGGDGYEDFRNSSVSEDAGREDSTNHLLLWKI